MLTRSSLYSITQVVVRSAKTGVFSGIYYTDSHRVQVFVCASFMCQYVGCVIYVLVLMNAVDGSCRAVQVYKASELERPPHGVSPSLNAFKIPQTWPHNRHSNRHSHPNNVYTYVQYNIQYNTVLQNIPTQPTDVYHNICIRQVPTGMAYLSG